MKKFCVVLCVMFLVIGGRSAFAATSPGDVWLTPSSVTVNPGDPFALEVHLDSGSQFLAAYGFDFTYDSSLVAVDTVTPGLDGFVAAVNANNPGLLIVSGFHVIGTDPGADLHLLSISFLALSGVGVSTIDLDVNSLVDNIYNDVGIPTGYGATISVGQPVPVPTTMLLLGSGLLGLAGFRRRFSKN